MESIRHILSQGQPDLVKQYVMGIMSTGGVRARRGRDLLAKGTISTSTAVKDYYLPQNATMKDIAMFGKDLKHYLGTPRKNVLKKMFGFV